MEAIDFKERNIIIAKDQPQYKPIPALRNEAGDVTMCFQLSPEEIEEIGKTGKLWLAVKTFNNPLQPMFLTTKKSDLIEGSEPEPEMEENKIECDFCSWIGGNSEREKNGHCPKCQSPTTKNKDKK